MKDEHELNKDYIASLNEQGQFQLDDILTHPEGEYFKKRGVIRLYVPDGRGLHLSSHGEFKGFIYKITESDFELHMCSDCDYEGMVVDIDYEDAFIAMILEEKGLNNIEIELSPLIEAGRCTVPFYNFIKALKRAKEWLIEAREIPEVQGIKENRLDVCGVIEHGIAHVFCEGHIVASISQKNGTVEIELFPVLSNEHPSLFFLDGFIEALESARGILWNQRIRPLTSDG